MHAAFWAPSMAEEKDIILEAIAELPDLDETEDQFSPTQPEVRRSETGQTAPPPQW